MDSSQTRTDLTRFIKNQAFFLGFNCVGIAQAEQMEVEGNHLQIWLDLRYHATMDWMQSRAGERKDILMYIPEAKSVVSLAMNYFHGSAKGALKVSNYAWGDDYHEVLKGKIFRLLADIQEIHPDIGGLVCVDTSPVMEKAWARHAGIGWIGKHTNVITRDYGSWVFLGELILDHELDYDRPFDKDLCGSCTACLKACPTGAIVDEYIVDANRCISYVTIEHRGDLADEMIHQLNGWIYGCDICQEVCPWNIKFAKRSSESQFAPRGEIVDRTPDQWQDMREDDYRRIFRKSAVKRIKFERLKRNIEVNSGIGN